MPKTKTQAVKAATIGKRPTGSAVSVAAAALILLGALGVEIDAQLNAAILGLVGAVVAWRNPR